MFSKQTNDFIVQELLTRRNIIVSSTRFDPVGGGSINDVYHLIVNDSYDFFLKVNKAARYPALFEKEKEGLEFLSRQQCICIPTVISCGVPGVEQILLLEFIPSGSRSENFWKKFGEQLALLHRCTSEKCGFSTDNYMGALPQKNKWTAGWTEFFVSNRIMPQVALAVQKDLLPKEHVALFEQLYKKLDTIFNQESPVLLHGDLWSGNFLCNERSEPVLIDPAVYYGHRNMDLGMTTLFGGFDKIFYDAYDYHFPFPSNYREQWEICNLYPLLIHLNLFGQGYLGEIAGILMKFK